MSIRVLRGKKHTPYDDIQSFFYVLIFLCLEYAGPALPRDWNILSHKALRAWIEGESFDAIGLAKFAIVGSRECFGEIVLDQLPRYFQDFRTLLDDLRECIFHEHEAHEASGGKKATHERIIQILRARLAEPLDEEFNAAEALLNSEEREERHAVSTFLVNADIDGDTGDGGTGDGGTGDGDTGDGDTGMKGRGRAEAGSGDGDDSLQRDDVQGQASASTELSRIAASGLPDSDEHSHLTGSSATNGDNSLHDNDNEQSISSATDGYGSLGDDARSFSTCGEGDDNEDSHSTGSPATDRDKSLRGDGGLQGDNDENSDSTRSSMTGNGSKQQAKHRCSELSQVIVPRSCSTGSPTSNGGNDDVNEHLYSHRPAKRHRSQGVSAPAPRIVIPQLRYTQGSAALPIVHKAFKSEPTIPGLFYIDTQQWK